MVHSARPSALAAHSPLTASPLLCPCCLPCPALPLQVTDCLTDMAFLNCRPSVIAAALLYVERRSRGIIPFWPSMLAKLTGYQVGGLACRRGTKLLPMLRA